MAYVRIRHEVSKTYTILDEGHEDRELLLTNGRSTSPPPCAHSLTSPSLSLPHSLLALRPLQRLLSGGELLLLQLHLLLLLLLARVLVVKRGSERRKAAEE